MCVIIVKPAGIVIPEEKIVAACHVNPDGYGITTIQTENNKNSFLTTRHYDAKGNKSDEVMDIMTKFKDSKQFIHLRFTTKGEKNIINCHPFESVTPEVGEQFGVDYQFMHNGTIFDSRLKEMLPSDADDKKYSDSWLFNEFILKPFVDLHLKAGQDPLDNSFFDSFIGSYSGNGVFAFYDNNGKCKLYGKDGVTYKEGDIEWWASNSYSFNSSHREPTRSYSYGQGYGSHGYGGNSNVAPFPGSSNSWMAKSSAQSDNKSENKNVSENSAGTQATTTSTGKKDERASQEKAKAVLYSVIQDAKRRNFSWSDHTAPEERLTFANLMDDHFDITDVCSFTDEEIFRLVEECPTAAGLLIMDLIYELYEKNDKKAVAN